MRLVNVADRLGMLPRSFIENDPMYASAFFANMASLGMPAVYHHLYEYGTCGIFSSLGRPTTEPGSPTSGPDRRRTMNVRWTYDERVEDGLMAWYAIRRFAQVLEDPAGTGLTVESVAPDRGRGRDPRRRHPLLGSALSWASSATGCAPIPATTSTGSGSTPASTRTTGRWRAPHVPDSPSRAARSSTSVPTTTSASRTTRGSSRPRSPRPASSAPGSPAPGS